MIVIVSYSDIILLLIKIYFILHFFLFVLFLFCILWARAGGVARGEEEEEWKPGVTGGGGWGRGGGGVGRGGPGGGGGGKNAQIWHLFSGASVGPASV